MMNYTKTFNFLLLFFLANNSIIHKSIVFISESKMHFKDLFSKQCVLGTIGLCLAGFGAMFAVFWADFFDSMLAKVSGMDQNN